jgi:SAM-dependent methyltransferase
MKIDYSRHYQKWHNDTPEHQAATREFYQRILAGKLPADKNARIIDVGCGMGHLLLSLKSLGYANLSGLEYDPGQAAAAQKKGLDVRLTQNTAATLREHAGEYDLLFCMDVLEHIPREAQLEFAAALCVALKPGGRLICSVPNANSPIAARWRYIDWTHYWSFTEPSLDLLLYSAGFPQIDIAAVEFHVRPKLWWLPLAGGGRHWWAFRLVRLWYRLVYMAELGPAAGRAIPLSPNLLAIASKTVP